jgi:histidine triad (HIT) family protein
MSDCIFCRIIKGEIPSAKVYEDDEILAFKDIHPHAPVHFLIIPKKHLASLADAAPEDVPVLGRMLELAPRLARELGAGEGFRSIINTGRHGGQEVYHLHIHILGGQQLPAMIKY